MIIRNNWNQKKEKRTSLKYWNKDKINTYPGKQYMNSFLANGFSLKEFLGRNKEHCKVKYVGKFRRLFSFGCYIFLETIVKK